MRLPAIFQGVDESFHTFTLNKGGACNAQYMRVYRKRKQLQTAEKESLILKKVPKTGAEWTREYKLRKQQLLQANASTSVAGNRAQMFLRETQNQGMKTI
jgi:hypothetical protein